MSSQEGSGRKSQTLKPRSSAADDDGASATASANNSGNNNNNNNNNNISSTNLSMSLKSVTRTLSNSSGGVGGVGAPPRPAPLPSPAKSLLRKHTDSSEDEQRASSDHNNDGSLSESSSSAPAMKSRTPSAGHDVRALQQQTMLERELRLQAERQCFELRSALESGLKSIVEQVESSNATLAAELQRLGALLDTRNAACAQQISALAARLASSTANLTSASYYATSVPASSNAGGSAATPPGTPQRGSLAILSPISPAVHGLLNELELLDSELERRVAKDKDAFMRDTTPISALAPNAMASDAVTTNGASLLASGGDRRRSVVESMLANEDDYLDGIGSMIKGYLQPLGERAAVDSSLISTQDVDDIFRSVQAIYDRFLFCRDYLVFLI